MDKLTLSEIGDISILIDQPEISRWNLLLAHGAGAGMEHSFLSALSKALAEHGFRVIRFNFPYKERGRKMPGSPKEAILCWREMVTFVLHKFPQTPLFLSGKSYGGRMASHLISEHKNLNVNGLIYFGFPLHPSGKTSLKRAEHLSQLKIPQLFLQGTQDKLADIALIRQLATSLPQATIVELEGADHSFKVPKSSGISSTEMIARLSRETTGWVNGISPVN